MLPQCRNLLHRGLSCVVAWCIVSNPTRRHWGPGKLAAVLSREYSQDDGVPLPETTIPSKTNSAILSPEAEGEEQFARGNERTGAPSTPWRWVLSALDYYIFSHWRRWDGGSRPESLFSRSVSVYKRSFCCLCRCSFRCAISSGTSWVCTWF